jgi:hypothetical protein
MSILPSEKGFDEISSSIFRVETSWSGKMSIGTGFIVGKMRDSQKLIIATAKHVLNFPENETIRWKVQQFNEYSETVRTLSFGTNHRLKGDVPYRTHNSLDVGLCILPSHDNNGKFFAKNNEVPVRIINPKFGVSTGTRVSWAGFPWVIEQTLGSPQLCYFEGVISSMVNRQNKKIYVVDGHATKGVSGGPVWHWSEERNMFEVVGIVCEYRSTDDRLPGFCFFEPINPVVYYLNHWRSELTDDFLITNVG